MVLPLAQLSNYCWVCCLRTAAALSQWLRPDSCFLIGSCLHTFSNEKIKIFETMRTQSAKVASVDLGLLRPVLLACGLPCLPTRFPACMCSLEFVRCALRLSRYLMVYDMQVNVLYKNKRKYASFLLSNENIRCPRWALQQQCVICKFGVHLWWSVRIQQTINLEATTLLLAPPRSFLVLLTIWRSTPASPRVGSRNGVPRVRSETQISWCSNLRGRRNQMRLSGYGFTFRFSVFPIAASGHQKNFTQRLSFKHAETFWSHSTSPWRSLPKHGLVKSKKV